MGEGVAMQIRLSGEAVAHVVTDLSCLNDRFAISAAAGFQIVRYSTRQYRQRLKNQAKNDQLERWRINAIIMVLDNFF